MGCEKTANRFDAIANRFEKTPNRFAVLRIDSERFRRTQSRTYSENSTTIFVDLLKVFWLLQQESLIHLQLLFTKLS
jgi:hypothetical protein